MRQVERMTGGVLRVIVFSKSINLQICNSIILQICKFINLQTHQIIESRQGHGDVDNIDWMQAGRFRLMLISLTVYKSHNC